MWQYNYTDELMHYGVLGMKWGHRKAANTSSTLNRVKSAKAAKKAAYKKYSKDYDSAYNYSSRHLVSQYVGKKQKAESDRRWDQASKSAEKYVQAKKEYKHAKADRKEKIKSQTKELNKQASFGEKLLFKDATRKRAAKYIVDNNMTVAEAKKKAQGDALRNTAVFMAAYGAVAVTSLYNIKRLIKE